MTGDCHVRFYESGRGRLPPATHQAPEIKTWLAHPRRARWHLHFTPTSSSWLNLVERWFKELTDRRLRRGTFHSVPHLIDAIGTWVAHWNTNPKPFVWHAAAEDILAKVRRSREHCHKSKPRRTTSVLSRRFV